MSEDLIKNADFSINLVFKDDALGELIKKACLSYFPDILYSDESDLLLTDDQSEVLTDSPAILFSNEEIDNLDKTAVIHFPFRLGMLLDIIQRNMNKKSFTKWGDKEIGIGEHHLRLRDGMFSFNDKRDPVYLTEKEREILLYLLNAQEIVDKKTLLDNIWGYAEGVETHTLETHIYRLRKKIEKSPANPEILITDGNGYRLF
jgi:hypothetical protein